MADQLAALNAQRANMTAYTDDLLNCALAAYKSLWPEQVPPSDPVDLGSDLELSSVCLGEWRDFTARIGADEALTYFLSWYEKTNLKTLHSVREGSMWILNPALIRQHQELAHNYVDYAQTDVFMPNIHRPAKDADAESLTPTRMKKTLKMELQSHTQPRPVEGQMFLMLDPALLRPRLLPVQLQMSVIRLKRIYNF
jgi:hypothetical protein